MTPMLKQYYDLKAQHSDAVLFFRMGDFYEIFGDDAQLVAPLLEITLTSRERGDSERIPFCGVPHHSARNYWLRLLKLGKKVAIADQIEDPKLAKGLVKRAVTRVLSPGCIEDLDGLDSEKPNYTLAILEVPTKGRSSLVGQRQWALGLADISTGELRLGTIEDETELVALVERLLPRELLVRKFEETEFRARFAALLKESEVFFSFFSEGMLRDRMAQAESIGDVFGSQEIMGQPCGKVLGGEGLIAGMLEHFKRQLAPHKSFLTIRPLLDPGTLALGETVLRDLEIFETARRREIKGSLFSELNHCKTPMGARLFRQALAFPSTEKSFIESRREAVSSLLGLESVERGPFEQSLGDCIDIERLATRIISKGLMPAELLKIALTLDAGHKLGEKITSQTSSGSWLLGLAEVLVSGKRNGDRLLGLLRSDGQGLGTGTGVFAAGFDAELDRLNSNAENGEAQVAKYEQRLREETGITSLRVKKHQSLGLLIEVTKSHITKVPAQFIRRQTMVNGERYVTENLQRFGAELEISQQCAIERERSLYEQLLESLVTEVPQFRRISSAMAELDLIFSLSTLAKTFHYVRPTISAEAIEILGSRHPIVERSVGLHGFVANDIVLSGRQNQMLITGPNMGGKSTVMRQVAISAILNQIGAYVPARQAKLPIFDRIFTRVGASDDLARGQSTFMVEMTEAAAILRQATAKSLVILDEVGRGTSTTDGLAIASAILEDLATRVQGVTLFATHYHELVEVAQGLPRVRLFQMEVKEKKEGVLFSHRLIPGAAESSFGIEVARLAGLPDAVVMRARENLQRCELASGPCSVLSLPLAAKASEAPPAEISRPLEAKGLKAKVNEKSVRIVERLVGLKIHSTTPLQALNILDELKAMTAQAEQGSLFQ